MEKIDQSQIYISGIGKLLSEGKLTVPPYQRSYSWEEIHVSELLADFKSSFESQSEDYFLGTIVVVRKDNGTREIVDGQQRLATSAILICSIRDFIQSMQDSDSLERARIIESDFLFKRDKRTLEKIQNLQLNEVDDPFFSSTILTNSTDNTLAQRSSHKRLSEALILARNFTAKEFPSKDPTELLEFLDFIESRAKVIHIQVDDESYAYTIFETLNDRGLELSELDLVKNLLFSLSGISIAAVRSNWNEMLVQLDSLNKERMSLDFLRHFWSCLNGLTRKRQLYSSIRAKVRSREEAVNLSEELSFASLTYVALLNSESDVWKSYNHDTREAIRTLNLLNMQQNRPLILAALSKFAKEDVERTIQNLVPWAIRFIVNGKLGSSALEDNFASNANKVWQKEIKDYKTLFGSMKRTIPSDEDFQHSALSWIIARADFARYVLRTLEGVAKNHGELTPNDSPNILTLEHVLPKNPDPKDWPDFSPDEHHAFHRRLGNLCLLEGNQNSHLGNVPFEDKKAVLTASNLASTQMIGNYEKWTKESIQKRQARLAEWAVRAWPIG